MNEKEKLSDEILMGLYQNGDERALEELYKRYSGRIYGYIQKRLAQDNWVDDVFQLVFTKLHQTRHQYNPDFLFSQWIFVMTKTVLLDFWKTTDRKTKRFFSTPLNESTASLMPTAEALSLLPDLATTGLSTEQRAVIELKFMDELSYQEIATRLNRTEESVRQLVSRALRKLRGQFKTDRSPL